MVLMGRELRGWAGVAPDADRRVVSRGRYALGQHRRCVAAPAVSRLLTLGEWILLAVAVVGLIAVASAR